MRFIAHLQINRTILITLKKIILIVCLFSFYCQAAISQFYTSRDNYTGAWETASSWNPEWTTPLTILSGYDIIINGYITVNDSLIFSGTNNTLIINDTLVIKGNMSLGNNTNLIINDNGILIVMGNFTFNNQTSILANGYFIVSGNFTKNGSQGLLTSNDNPVKAFIGGKISPAGITNNNTLYPAIYCTAPGTVPYANSKCSYGNLADLKSDPIYSFFQNICSETNVNSNITVCVSDTIKLTSSNGKSYIWKGPNGFTSNEQNPRIPNADTTLAGNYMLTVLNNAGCTDTDTTNVVVNENPVASAGPNQKIEFATETVMKAELSSSETGQWSLISGSGILSDIHSPTTKVTQLSIGKNIFLWSVSNGNCDADAEVIITVPNPFVPSVITPNGDGINDYFMISDTIGKVELIIFNRWGTEEYSNSNYLNDWHGQNNKEADLPYDTYFYILRFSNLKIIKGSVLIKR